MSINTLKAVFESASKCDAWSMQLLHISTSKRYGINYCSRNITFNPEKRLHEFISELSNRYINNQNGVLYSFTDVAKYDGTASEKTIYKLTVDDLLIRDAYNKLKRAIATPDSETNPLEFPSQAYILNGEIVIYGEEHQIKFISMQRPVTALKNRFVRDNGSFREIKDKVLYLRPALDVIILDDCVYLLKLAGENLFNIEHAYKAICIEKIDEIIKCDILSDIHVFSTIAGSGHNPRRFISFNNNRLEKLKNSKNRKIMAQKFAIPLTGDKFDTSKDGVVDKIVKLLCDKGMVDPFENIPVEVAGAKKWV